MKRAAPLLFSGLIACAAASPSGVADQAGRAEGPAYERILPSFAVSPRALLLVPPSVNVRVDRHQLRAMDALVDRFDALGDVRGEAAARLSRAAMWWATGRARRAYEDVVEAQALFGEARDVHGLAKSYEWLGFMFDASGAVDRAAEHLSVAYVLYGSLTDRTSQRRVLAYAED